MRNELNTDGKIVSYQSSVQFVKDLDATIVALFSQGIFSCVINNKNGMVYEVEVKNDVTSTSEIYDVYAGNIRNERRNPKEKKIQLNGKDPRTSTNTALIIGVYCYDANDVLGDLIITAWCVDKSMDYTTNPSIRGINVDLFQEAKFFGIKWHPYKKNTVNIFRPEFIHYYLSKRIDLHCETVIETISDDFDYQSPNVLTAPTPQGLLGPIIPRNKIIYGAPGTGKSFELRDQASRNDFIKDNIIRVTFHPNYTYQQFVGAFKPSPIYKNIAEGESLYKNDKTTILEGNDKKEPLIDYTFIEGPLLDLLVKALKDSDQNYLLIIEEINRASVSSVFGDVFQLLDRKEDGSGEYDITFNNEAMSFFRSKEIFNPKIKLPSNFFIWATMNSADQGVMPLDAAFKRRWAFEYLALDNKQTVVADRTIQFQSKTYNWNAFRKQVNDKLKSIEIAEDKLIGPFFMNKNELNNIDSIKNKLLLYLRDDVVRHNPSSLFAKSTYSDIVNMYDTGDNIFVDFEITNPLPDLPTETASEE